MTSENDEAQRGQAAIAMIKQIHNRNQVNITPEQEVQFERALTNSGLPNTELPKLVNLARVVVALYDGSNQHAEKRFLKGGLTSAKNHLLKTMAIIEKINHDFPTWLLPDAGPRPIAPVFHANRR